MRARSGSKGSSASAATRPIARAVARIGSRSRTRTRPQRRASWNGEMTADYTKLLTEILHAIGGNQAALAERLQVTQPTISRWISGKHKPDIYQYFAIASLARSLKINCDDRALDQRHQSSPKAAPVWKSIEIDLDVHKRIESERQTFE